MIIKIINDGFLNCNVILENFKADKLKKVGSSFLTMNNSLIKSMLNYMIMLKEGYQSFKNDDFQAEQSNYFGTERISKILFKMAPPVMLAQLIQALYNIVDSVFVGRFSDSGLTALSIIYPIQLLMIALAVGTGVGINTIMAAKLGLDQKEEAKEYAGVGTPLAGAL